MLSKHKLDDNLEAETDFHNKVCFYLRKVFTELDNGNTKWKLSQQA